MAEAQKGQMSETEGKGQEKNHKNHKKTQNAHSCASAILDRHCPSAAIYLAAYADAS